MAAKDTLLKKRIIKEAVIAAVVLLVLLGGGVLVSNYDNDTQAEKSQKESETNALRAENESLQAQLGSWSEVLAYYDVYTKNHSSDFALNREAVTSMLGTLREANHLVNLGVTISPTSAVAGDMGLKTGKLIKSEVKLTFGALSDNSVYGFIEALQRQLPGIVLVYDIKVTHVTDLSRNILLEDLNQHKITPLVSGEVSFIWIGIRPANPEEKPGPEASAAAP